MLAAVHQPGTGAPPADAAGSTVIDEIPAAVYAGLADLVLVVHGLVVLFVLFGFAAGVAWLIRGRPAWILHPAFRYSHLAAVGIVVGQAWLGKICPLTSWENALRRRAGQSGYEETFIAHWLHPVLFYTAPAWVFTVIYSVFGVLVGLVWWRAAQRSRAGKRSQGHLRL